MKDLVQEKIIMIIFGKTGVHLPNLGGNVEVVSRVRKGAVGVYLFNCGIAIVNG